MSVAPVFDTSVLVDMFLESSSRHKIAAALAQALIAKKIRIDIPAFAMFEIQAAMRQAKIEGRYQIWNGISIDQPLKTRVVPIDEPFIAKYLDPNLPYLKGADLVFLAVAKKHGADLVTEDAKMSAAARKANVSVFTAEQYLAKIQ